MALQLALPAELEERLREEAARRGVPKESAALQLLDEHLPHRENGNQLGRKANKLEELFQAAENSANSEDEYDLLKALDENRQGERPLFPPELKGVSW
jgi:hypothetical protein